jgi:hypothetical protein
MTKSVDTTADRGQAHRATRLGAVLVAAISIAWFLVLGFYAAVGSAARSISNDQSSAPAVAAGAAACVGAIGVTAFLKARSSGKRGLVLLALAAVFSGLAGLAWVATAGGSAIGWPAGLVATGSAAVFLVAGFMSRR